MSDRLWKATERAIARRLAGQRLPTSGRGDQPDVRTSWLSVEVKCRRRLPAWLLAALHQALAGASDGQLPVAILHEVGQRHVDDLVLVRLGDFERWFGPGAGEEEAP